MDTSEKVYRHPYLIKYENALDEFEGVLIDHRSFFDELDCFKPVLEHIDNLLRVIEDCREHIEEYEDVAEEEDTGVDINGLEELIKNEVIETFEELLDFYPQISKRIPKVPIPDELNKVISDFEDFVERYYEENIRIKGYKLYDVLICPAG